MNQIDAIQEITNMQLALQHGVTMPFNSITPLTAQQREIERKIEKLLKSDGGSND